jgi:O-antigen/teichoic acid export membrane protein
MGAATVFLVALSPELMSLLAPRGYSVATVAVLPIALSAIPSFFSSNASAAIIHRGKSGTVTLSSLACAVMNIFLSILLIPRFAYFGAGLALFLSLLSSAFLSVLIMRREVIPELIPTRALTATVVFSGALSSVALLLYNYAAARILLLIPPALTALSALISLKELVLEKRDALPA